MSSLESKIFVRRESVGWRRRADAIVAVLEGGGGDGGGGAGRIQSKKQAGRRENQQENNRNANRSMALCFSLSLIFFSPPSFSQLFYLVSFFLFSFLLLSHSKFYPFEKREGGVELFGFWPAYC